MPTKSKLATLVQGVADGDVEAVREHLNEGNANFRTPNDGVTLLARAVSLNFLEIAEMLIRNGASLMVPDNVGFYPFHRAAWSGTLEMAQLLLDHGADVNVLVEGHYVACTSTPRPVESHGSQAAERKTPLILAAMRGDVAVVSLLCAAGADVDARDAYNMNAMDHAALEGRAEVINFLLDRGSDGNAARVLCEYGSDYKATTVPQRSAYNEIAETLCTVWAPQSRVTVV